MSNKAPDACKAQRTRFCARRHARESCSAHALVKPHRTRACQAARHTRTPSCTPKYAQHAYAAQGVEQADKAN
eukprot:4295398-Pleurochrysis_carterae.AAC.1